MKPILASSLVVLLTANVATAQAPPRHRTVDDVLPSSTYAVVRFGGLAACAEASGELPLATLVASFLGRLPAEVRGAHLERGLTQMARNVQRAADRLAIGTDDLRSLVRRPMALAIGRLSIEGMGPSVAWIVDAGDSQASIERCVDGLVAVSIHNGLLSGPATAVDVHGVSMRRVDVATGVPLFFGSLDGHFVVTNSRGYVGEMVAVVRGGERGITAVGDLAALRQALPQPPLASLFVNAAPFVAMFDAHLPYEAADLGKALGLGRLDSIYAATTAGPHGGHDVMHLGLRGSEAGLCKALLAQPADLGFAAMCSPNTVAFASGSLDVPAVVDAFGRFVALLPAAVQQPLRESLAAGMAHDLRRHGMRPQDLDAMLRAFGTEVAIAIALEKGAVPKPELLVRLQVRDRQMVAGLLQRLEAASAGSGHVVWKTRKVGDAEIRFCNLEVPNARLQVSPCYLLRDTELVCGSDVAALVRALRQDDDAAGSLASQPDFQELAAVAGDASGVLHLRLFRAAELGWRTVESWAYPQVDAHRDEIGFGSDLLPDAEAMAEALGTSSFLYRVSDEGITVHNHGTLAIGSLFAAMGSLCDEVLDRAGAKVY